MESPDLQTLANDSISIVSLILMEIGKDTLDPRFSDLAVALTHFRRAAPFESNDQTLLREIRTICQEIESACTWPNPAQTDGFPTLRSLSTPEKRSRVRQFFLSMIPHRDPRAIIRRSLKAYVPSDPGVESLCQRIQDLSQRQPPGADPQDQAKAGNDLESIPRHTQDENRHLHQILRLHMVSCPDCEPEEHLARLRLGSQDGHQDDGTVRFEMLFSVASSTPHINWKETALLVRRHTTTKHVTIQTGEEMPITPQRESQRKPHPIKEGDFCRLLRQRNGSSMSFQLNFPVLNYLEDNEESENRVDSVQSTPLSSILETHKLSKKAKCILAYTVAMSVWRFYDSSWMENPWTHEDIHLLNDQISSQQPNNGLQHLYRVYLATNFQRCRFSGREAHGSEYLDGPDIMHRYPKVLALGILLLEIAQGSPFPKNTARITLDESTVNEYVTEASALVRKGAFGSEDDFNSYTDAVKSCLNLQPFGDAPFTAHNIEQRMEILFCSVVRPLKKLLDGTGWLKEVEWIKPEPFNPRPGVQVSSFTDAETSVTTKSDLQTIDAVDSCGKVERTERLLDRDAFLGQMETSTPEAWLGTFMKINSIVGPTKGNEKSVKIAVLDTGCDLERPIFKEFPELRKKVLRHWKDMTADDAPEPLDIDGHGTQIVSVLLRIAPHAEIFVIRVARDSRSLGESQDNVARAINYSAGVAKADIVSMSFGFANEAVSVKDAISDALRRKNDSIVFFAAAANHGQNLPDMFPACLDSVISVRGTDCNGAFESSFNPPNYGTKVYGTLGKDVPYTWPCKSNQKTMSGCSIATVIAAATAALIIHCATGRLTRRELEVLRRREAILRVFENLFPTRGAEMQFYVAPFVLFTKKEEIRLAHFRVALGWLRVSTEE